MLSDDTIQEEQANGHSMYGGSRWHRLLVCAGSLAAEIGKPDTARFEAAEGTVAHEIAALWLQSDLTRVNFGSYERTTKRISLPTGTYEIPIDATMFNHLERYVDWCRETPALERLVEYRVDLSPWTPIPDQGGTVDYAALALGHLMLTDLKYGTGVQVFAENNPQLSAYALGVIREFQFLYSFEKVTLRIAQPRLEHWDVWETTVAELETWGEQAKAKLVLTWQPGAPRTPSEDACKFCKARGTCPAAVTLMDRIADATFEDVRFSEATSALTRIESAAYKIVAPAVADLTTAQIGRMLEFRKVVEHHMDAAYDELVRRCVAGNEPIPEAWMLAQGKASRYVRDVHRLIRCLVAIGFNKADAYATELKSPAQLEAMLVEWGYAKKEAVALIEPAVQTTPGKPTLALKTKGKKVAVDLADVTFVNEASDDL